MSSSLVKRPIVTRSEPRARMVSKPIAVSTYEGSPALWALQALPDETAMPASSSANSSLMASASWPEKPRHRWPGRRW